MKNLFYSHDEKILFFIGGYHYNCTDLNDLLQNLKKGKEIISQFLPKYHAETIYTDVINESRRYKYMRVFWTTIKDAPSPRVFTIGAGEHKWTMNQWLKG